MDYIMTVAGAWPSWRNGEILGARVLRASSLDKVLSSRSARNELMR
jgi:hypothetical protein